MRLVADILTALTHPDCDVASLLRQARILANELNNGDLAQWAGAELNGYGPELSVPDYRKIFSPPLGAFSGAGGTARRVMLPLSQFPENLRELANSLYLRNPIREIAGFVGDDGRPGMHIWPAEAVFLLRERIGMNGMQLVEIHQPVTRAAVDGILDSVRNRLLEFVLSLVRLNPELKESDAGINSLPSLDVQRAVQISIFGHGNVVAAGQSFTQQGVSIANSIGDVDQLERHLSTHGVEASDLSELRKALSADGKPEAKALGPKVRKWMGQMLAKAAEGTWKVAVESAPTLIGKALAKYYGWDS